MRPPLYPIQRLTSGLQFAMVFILLLTPAFGFAELQEFPHAQAELIFEQKTVQSDRILAGLRLIPEEQWHFYWRYAGDSGAPPKLKWSIDGQTVSAKTLWPLPERIRLGPFVNYGYPEEVLLMAELPQPVDRTSTKTITVSLDAEWLVCKEECIPGNAIFTGVLSVETGAIDTKKTPHPLFQKFLKRLPSPSGLRNISVQVDQATSTFLLSFQSDAPLENPLVFLPAQPGLIQNAAPQAFTRDGNAFTLALKPAVNFSPTAKQLEGILIPEPSVGSAPLGLAPSGHTISVALPPSAGVLNGDLLPEERSLLFVLLAAFLGGMILNLMPCVFPVLSIKILGFVKKAGEHPKKVRMYGVLFAAGVIVSFWVLVILVLLLKSSGQALGWGFQLQNPVFVGLLVLLLLGLALNLLGVFEVGGLLQRVAGRAPTAKHSDALSSFGNGVLATVLATPCTAPFMAGAVAYGLTGPTWRCFLVFTTLGTGLSLPYLLLSLFPAWLTRLPKPGRWMEICKRVMAVPLLGTAVWLGSVYFQQTTSESHLKLYLACLILTCALLVYGRLGAPVNSRTSRSVSVIALLCGLLLCTLLILQSDERSGDSETKLVDQIGTYSLDSFGLKWYEYHPEIVSLLQKQGYNVFLDFTAAWCVTCQFNKQVVFRSAEVREALTRRKVALVRADWTNKSRIITESLAEFGRAGVPLNVLYASSPLAVPKVFPSLLTAGIVLAELEKLPG